MGKRYILVKEADNNVTVVDENGINPGELLEGIEVRATDFVPYGNKMAIKDIAKDAPVIRYGVEIAYAAEHIKKGGYIDHTKLYIKTADNLDPDVKYVSQKKYFKAYPEKYFYGYENPDGSVGTKNLLAISTNVQCSEGFMNVLVDKIKKELLPKYPNVDDVVTVSHLYGCGVAIKGDNAEIPQRTIENILHNPNFGNQIMMVCLGCEKYTTDMIESVSSTDIIRQQDGSFQMMFDRAFKLAEKKLAVLNKRTRTKQPLSKLRLGMQCGGSDALSGLSANSVFGYVADRLVDSGASVIFSEVTEIRDAAHILLARMKDMETRRKFISQMKWYDNYLESSHVDRSANPSPGNKAGGLATIIDKAMGSVIKSGTSDIDDVIGPGELIRKPGLTFAATPASDFVCGTEQLASGITIMMFSTGRGTTYNLRQIPVLKVSTNNVLYHKWPDLIDYNAGEVAVGKKSMEEAGEELLSLLIDTASGKYITKSDGLGLYNQLAVFNPAPVT